MALGDGLPGGIPGLPPGAGWLPTIAKQAGIDIPGISSIGKMFGGGGHNVTFLQNLKFPSTNVPSVMKLQSDMIPQGGYERIPRNRYLGQALSELYKPVQQMMNLTSNRLKFLGFNDAAKEFTKYSFGTPATPQLAVANIQRGINITTATERLIDAALKTTGETPELREQFQARTGMDFDVFQSEFARQAESNIMDRRVNKQSTMVGQKTNRLAAATRVAGRARPKGTKKQIPHMISSLVDWKSALGQLQKESTRLGVPIADISGLKGGFVGGSFGKPDLEGVVKDAADRFIGPPDRSRRRLNWPRRRSEPGGVDDFASASLGGGSAFDISQLEKGIDRIIPSGFVSKQATTQNRALALDRIS